MKVLKRLCVAMLIGVMMAGQIELCGMGNKKRVRMEAASAAAVADDASGDEDNRPMQRSRHVEELDEANMVTDSALRWGVTGVVETDSEKKIVCEYSGCGKEFTRQNRLALHKKSVHEGAMYSCDVDDCGKNFSDNSNLARHKKAAHEGARYLCDVEGCGKEFAWQGDLTRHKKSAHEGVRYSCDGCGKSFTQKGDLAQHKKSAHEGVTYHCDVDGCGKEFSDNSQLTQHKKLAHEGARYLCDVDGCGKVFTWQGGLSRHKKAAHEGVRYFCDVDGCGKEFSDNSQLTQHKKSAHEGVRYACAECGKEFAWQGGLAAHKRKKRCKKMKQRGTRPFIAKVACAEDAGVAKGAAADVDYERALLQETGAEFGELDDFGGVVVEEELGMVLVIEHTALAAEIMSCIEDGIGIAELQIKNNAHMTDKELVEIAPYCLLLRKLDVSGCSGITKEGMSNFLGRCAGLHTLVVHEHDALTAADIIQLREISPGLKIEVIK